MFAKSRLHGAPPLADLDLPLPRHLALGPGVGGVRERGPGSALLQSLITLHPTHARVSPTWRATHLSAKDEEPVLEKVALDEPDDLLADLLAQVHALHHRPEGPEVRQTLDPVGHINPVALARSRLRHPTGLDQFTPLVHSLVAAKDAMSICAGGVTGPEISREFCVSSPKPAKTRKKRREEKSCQIDR